MVEDTLKLLEETYLENGENMKLFSNGTENLKTGIAKEYVWVLWKTEIPFIH